MARQSLHCCQLSNTMVITHYRTYVGYVFTKPVTSLSKKNKPDVTLYYKNPNGTEVHKQMRSETIELNNN